MSSVMTPRPSSATLTNCRQYGHPPWITRLILSIICSSDQPYIRSIHCNLCLRLSANTPVTRLVGRVRLLTLAKTALMQSGLHLRSRYFSLVLGRSRGDEASTCPGYYLGVSLSFVGIARSGLRPRTVIGPIGHLSARLSPLPPRRSEGRL